GIVWDADTKTLSGISRVVGNESYVITLATNGFKKSECESDDASTKLALKDLPNGLIQLSLEQPDNGEVKWSIRF
ncbi:MAG: hypothetical protein MI744_01160, partial [Pseudomonadales bacterium]|nr:hypothetical protein [Pseudomonadales bacterium]